jgi:hypothetical protein
VGYTDIDENNPQHLRIDPYLMEPNVERKKGEPNFVALHSLVRPVEIYDWGLWHEMEVSRSTAEIKIVNKSRRLDFDDGVSNYRCPLFVFLGLEHVGWTGDVNKSTEVC